MAFGLPNSDWSDNFSCGEPPKEKFTFFRGGPFSQWFGSKFYVEVEGKILEFACAEQYMMYCKAMSFKNYGVAEKIMATPYPRDHKALGRKVQGFDDKLWMTVAEEIVYTGNFHKFTQNPELRRQLIATRGTTLVEASPSDIRWGIGLSEDDPRALDRSQWLGQNLLGKVLTELREHLIIRAQQRTKVVHCMKEDYDIYIGRGKDPKANEVGIWGNPFEVGKDGTRDQVITKHREWIKTQPELLARIHTLQGKTLGCWCSPLLCHGYTLAAMADGLEV